LSSVIWSDKDFDVFKVPGLEPRMGALIGRVRPKLEQLGAELAPYLTTLTEEEMYPHVAKHARRTVNPPNDTWVAWANNKRGYKAWPHFQVGLWPTHLFVQFAIIYECNQKHIFAENMEKELDSVKKEIPQSYFWSFDHMQPEVILHQEMNDQDFRRAIERLKNVKKAEILCGLKIERSDPILKDGQALRNQIKATFKTVAPLYRMAF
jgi:uncharacterized protein YktB (UPF0637 family)